MRRWKHVRVYDYMMFLSDDGLLVYKDVAFLPVHKYKRKYYVPYYVADLPEGRKTISMRPLLRDWEIDPTYEFVEYARKLAYEYRGKVYISVKKAKAEGRRCRACNRLLKVNKFYCPDCLELVDSYDFEDDIEVHLKEKEL